MGEGIIAGVAVPVATLALAGWLVPWALGRALPEGAGWLALNAAASAAILALGAAAGFVWLYGAAGPAVLRADPGHLAQLSARSALVWGPLMALSLADQPRRWRAGRW